MAHINRNGIVLEEKVNLNFGEGLKIMALRYVCDSMINFPLSYMPHFFSLRGSKINILFVKTQDTQEAEDC